MRQKLLALFALSSLAHGQMAQVTSAAEPAKPTESAISAEADPLSLAQPLVEAGSRSSQPAGVEGFTTLPTVTFYQRHDALRREREEELVVAPCLVNKAHQCVLEPSMNQKGLLLRSLEIEPRPGITVSYRQANRFRTLPAGGPVFTGAGVQVFRLKIRADRSVPIGASVLQGKLKYQIRVTGRRLEEHEVDLVIPVTIVDHDAPVVEARWSLDNGGHHHVGRRIIAVVLAPIAVPIVLIWASALLITCAVDRDDCV